MARLRQATTARMRFMVRYQRAVKVSDGKGGHVVQWATVADTWCDIKTLSLRERMRYSQFQIDVTHVLSHRWVNNLTSTNLRALEITDNEAEERVFDIISVDDVGERGEYQSVTVRSVDIKQKPLIASETQGTPSTALSESTNRLVTEGGATLVTEGGTTLIKE